MTDIVTYCDVNTCEDCPRYADDCDGDKYLDRYPTMHEYSEGKRINPKLTDLISRADAIEAVRKKLQDWGGYAFEDYRRGLYEAQDILEALPSADAVHGEWKHTITWQPYCSNCEYVFGEDEEFSPFWKYCPMCGARMKGGDSE